MVSVLAACVMCGKRICESVTRTVRLHIALSRLVHSLLSRHRSHVHSNARLPATNMKPTRPRHVLDVTHQHCHTQLTTRSSLPWQSASQLSPHAATNSSNASNCPSRQVNVYEYINRANNPHITQRLLVTRETHWPPLGAVVERQAWRWTAAARQLRMRSVS